MPIDTWLTKEEEKNLEYERSHIANHEMGYKNEIKKKLMEM